MNNEKLPYPFGDPEEARTNSKIVTRGGGEDGDESLWKAVFPPPSDLRGRIFVGTDGASKTLALRRAKAFATGSSDLFAGELETIPPPTADVIRFDSHFSSPELRQNWKLLWRRAISRSAISHMLNVPQLRASIPEQFIFSFSHSFKALLRGGGQSGSATGVLAEAATILRDHDCADVRTYLYAPLWDQLEYKLQEALKHCLPLCLYIDGLPLAPLQWLECQEGLYRAIMELLTEYVFGSRLFIFASLTEQALAKASPEGNGLRDFEELFVRRLG